MAIKLLLPFTLLFLMQYEAFSQVVKYRCATVEYAKNQVKKDGTLEKRQQEIKEKIQFFIDHKDNNKTAVTYIIPVVVHLLYNTSIENISDAQIKSQIDVLNEDYGRENADASQTPGPFTAVAGIAPIHFCLVQADTNGKHITGIIRKFTAKKEFDMNTEDAKYTKLGGDDAWDSIAHLNIWVVPAIKSSGGSDVLGYTSFIGGAPELDGVVIRFDCFGRVGNVNSEYSRGRTTTHEVGHWLNLNHIWGDDSGACSGSDFVDDTPNQASEDVGMPVFPKTDSCSPSYPGIMFMNYMDYTDDAGMNMFTKGQVDRMVAAIEIYRPSLKTASCRSPEITEENVYPNPSKGLIYVDVFPKSYTTINITVYNLIGEVLSENYQETIVKGRYIMDLSELVNGFYFINVQTDVQQPFTKKVILWEK